MDDFTETADNSSNLRLTYECQDGGHLICQERAHGKLDIYIEQPDSGIATGKVTLFSGEKDTLKRMLERAMSRLDA